MKQILISILLLLIGAPALHAQAYPVTANANGTLRPLANGVAVAAGGSTTATGTAGQVLVNGTSGSAQNGPFTFTLPPSISTLNTTGSNLNNATAGTITTASAGWLATNNFGYSFGPRMYGTAAAGTSGGLSRANLALLDASAGASAMLLTTNASGIPIVFSVNDTEVGRFGAAGLSVSSLNGGTGASGTTFWRGDGTWGTPAGGGSVTLSANNAFTGNNTYAGTSGFTGAIIGTFTAMPALAVDFTKYGNTYTATANQTFTYSGATAWAQTRLKLTSTGGPWTITIPSTYSYTLGTSITSIVVPASTSLVLSITYNGSTYEMVGDPVPVSGASGSYLLLNGTPSTNNIPQFNGTNWVPTALSGGGTVTVSGTTPVAGQSAEWTSATAIQAVSVTGTVSYVKSTSPTLVTPALGTPSALVLTNATGLPLGTTGVTGILTGTNGGTGVNNSTRTMTYAGNVAFTGAFNPTFAIPLTATYTFPAAAGTLATLANAETLTNKRVNPRFNTITSSATPAPNTDTTDLYTVTALATAITSFTPTGTPVEGQQLLIRILDNGTARAITWGASYIARGAALPTTTVASKYLYVIFVYNAVATKWDCVSVSSEL